MKILRRFQTLVMFTFLLRALTGLASAAVPLDLGATAPAIQGTNQDGKAVDLGAQYKKGYVLVYFYPKAGTPGCTAEACSLRDAFADLNKLNLTVIGVSHDTVAEQKTFAVAQKLPFDLLADPKGDIYAAFGVPGLINRQSFLVKDGKVVWREVKATTAEQANDVKKALADLTAKDAAAQPAASTK
jgi:thioredoxin-dependent peroxiredoxin